MTTGTLACTAASGTAGRAGFGAPWCAAGADVEFVGHPAVDVVRPSMDAAAVRRQFGVRALSLYPVLQLWAATLFYVVLRRGLTSDPAFALFLLSYPTGRLSSRADLAIVAVFLFVTVPLEFLWFLFLVLDSGLNALGIAPNESAAAPPATMASGPRS